ncbi:MAG: hypothetical protein AAF840_06150 [Bacteroidota bacterium]
MPKTKMTAFSRFLLFLLIFIPLAFVGASYYNGEDPVANLKNLIGMEATSPAQQADQSTTVPAPTSTSSQPPATFENVQDLRDEITQLNVDLAVTKERLARCQTEGVE